MQEQQIVLFTDKTIKLEVPISPEQDTVWLTLEQMASLFEKDRSVIGKHIRNIFKEGELDESTSGQILPGSVGSTHRPPKAYNLDVVISVGYRVKSRRGIVFRKWANSILKEYIIKGYARNDKRLKQLNQSIQLLKRTTDKLESDQLLDVIEQYSRALNLLDDYDHQTISKPKGNKSTYVISYEECKNIISEMRFGAESDLFGNEKDDSFKSSINTIYQTFDGRELYPSTQEKAANLLYLIVKNHSFSDGNKRIAAAIFIYFLKKNDLLIIDGNKLIDDNTLVAITIMIAESKPIEKEIIVDLVMNFLSVHE